MEFKLPDKKILITGVTGFIGRNLAEILCSHKGYKVFGTYHKSAPFKNPNITFIQADLRNESDAHHAAKGMDIIIHAAAVTSGSKDIVERPHIHIADTVAINNQILKATFDNQVKHFFFLSCTVMYKPSQQAIKESDFKASDEIVDKYFGGAWLKIFFEKICQFYSKKSSTKFTVMRHSNCYGPFDKYNSEKSHVFAATITKVMQAKSKVTVWGNGTEKRDFLYIEDLADFILKALELQKAKYELFNIGYGKGTSIKELTEQVIHFSGKKLAIEFDTTKPTIPVDIYLDCSKAQKEFNWSPRTTLKQGIVKSIEFYKNNF